MLLLSLMTLGLSLIGLALALTRLRPHLRTPVPEWRIWIAPATVPYVAYAPAARRWITVAFVSNTLAFVSLMAIVVLSSP